MEDAPEEANGNYEYSGKTYQLQERDSNQWRVLDDGVHIGTVIEVSTTPEDGVLYTIEVADGEGRKLESTDDWRRAIETLIDLTSF